MFGLVAWMFNKYLLSSTTIFQITENSTFIGNVSAFVSIAVHHDESHCYFRIGRSGRFGRKGVAINFAKNEDIRILRDIEQYYSTQIDEMPMNGMIVVLFNICINKSSISYSWRTHLVFQYLHNENVTSHSLHPSFAKDVPKRPKKRKKKTNQILNIKCCTTENVCWDETII